MRRLAATSLGLWLLLGSGILTARLLGDFTGNPSSFALTIIRDSQRVEALWCWREICPGKTTFLQALDFVKATHQSFEMLSNALNVNLPSYHAVYIVSRMSGEVDVTAIPAQDSAITLGEAIRLWGEPIAGTSRFSAAAPGWNYVMCLRGGLCLHTAIEGYSPHLRPTTRVVRIYYLGRNTRIYGISEPWRGFRNILERRR